MADTSQHRLAAEGVKRLKTGEHFTDLIITCKGQEWRVHKLWLSAQSEFFQKTCSGDFEEGKTGTIRLSDDEPTIVAAMLSYLYDFGYEEHVKGNTKVAPTVFDAKMYIIADRLLISGLKNFSAKQFEQRATEDWTSPAFADAISTMYEGTLAGSTGPFKTAIFSVVKKNARKLFNSASGCDRFLEVLGQNVTFGKDVAIALATTYIEGSNFRCPRCSQVFGVSTAATYFRCPSASCTTPTGLTNWLQYEVKN